MTKMSQDIKIAVVQFGSADDPDLKSIAETANADWYLFDDPEKLTQEEILFEVEHLIRFYKHLFVYMKGVKE